MGVSQLDPVVFSRPVPPVSARVGLLVLPLVCGIAFGSYARAQVPPPSPGPTGERVTPEEVRTHRQQAEQATDLDDAAKQKILQTYDQALGMLDVASKSAARTAELQAKIDSAPDELLKTKETLAGLPSAPPAASADGRELHELKQILAEKEADLSKKKEASAALGAELTRRVNARKDVADQRSAAQQQLATIEKDLVALAGSEAPPAFKLAQRTLLLAHRQAVQQSVAAYEKELATYEATANLLPVQERLANAEAALAEQAFNQWRELVNRLTQQEAARKAEQARREELEADPALKPLAEANRQLAEKAEKAAQQSTAASERLKVINKDLEEVKQQSQRMEERVKAVGLTNAIGLLMRTRRAQLPDASDHYRESRARQSQIREVQTTLFELDDQRAEMPPSVDQHVESVLGEIRPKAGHIPAYELELAVRDLVSKQRQHLDNARDNSRECFNNLVDLDEAQQKLIQEIEGFAHYIDERVLWIRSADPLRLADLHESGWIVKKGLNPQGWTGWLEIAQAWKRDVQGRPHLLLLAICIFAPWIYAQRRLRAWLKRAGELAAASTGYEILPTLKALGLTVLVAAIWPAILWYLAWRLSSPWEATGFATAVAAGLSRAAGWFLPLEFFRQLCRPKGVAEAHFDWPTGSLRILHRHLRWFVLAGLPFVFVVGLLEALGIERWQASLGRLAFIGIMLLMAVWVQLVLRPAGGLFRHLSASGYEGWLYRLRYVWRAFGLAAPLSLAVLAGVGYFYTARQLAARLVQTVYLPLLLMLLGAVFARWVLVVRRRLAIERIRARCAAPEAPDSAKPGVAGIPAAPAPAEPEPDLTAMAMQTRRLLNSVLFLVAVLGIWWIWVEVLPALTMLDEVKLWSTTVMATRSIPGGDGPPILQTIERPEAITLADLGLAILILLMTAVAAKNVAGLLEMLMPQRLTLTAGIRYAITTITRYSLIIVGMILGFGALGIGWSKVQWLVAALTVGLGFGLQEIFANFVSGLILLFERPIRVGDVVTIGDVTGVVTQIQARATTVTNWDRKEFIVPNKEFITGRLLNWTRSDRINRVVITVGIAYGSDTERARRLLEKVVGEHPEIMDDPAPLVTFEGFGDSSLNFVVRCYLPTLDKRLATIHELHTAIDQAFREAGIEIAFPQRDIHVYSATEPSKTREQKQTDTAAD